jgi:hypothetical protein
MLATVFGGMDEEQVEAIVEKKKGELKSELRDELETGDTRIEANLGMFRLQIDADEPLDETVEAFEQLWENRIDELEESRADSVREKLEDDDVVLFG